MPWINELSNLIYDMCRQKVIKNRKISKIYKKYFLIGNSLFMIQ